MSDSSDRPHDRDGIIGDGLLDESGNPAVHDGDTGSDASGSQSDSAVTYDEVDSGQSEDIESSLTQQGVADRESEGQEARNERREIADDEAGLHLDEA